MRKIAGIAAGILGFAYVCMLFYVGGYNFERGPTAAYLLFVATCAGCFSYGFATNKNVWL